MESAPRIRVDLSEIALWKRLLLIALWSMVAASVTVVAVVQFCWLTWYVNFPVFQVLTVAAYDVLTVNITHYSSDVFGIQFFRCRYEDGSIDIAHFSLAHSTRAFPGLYYFHGTDGIFFGIHHAWLISTTAALYLFARRRIHRSARLQAGPQ